MATVFIPSLLRKLNYEREQIVTRGARCGICTPGSIVSSKALLESEPEPRRTGCDNII